MNLEAVIKRIAGYVRIQKAEKKDPEKIHRSLQKGYHIEHPERIMGYAGFFFELGDVYASGYVAEQMDNGEFRSFVLDSLRRFYKGEFGQISSRDEDENIENRWLFGIDRLFGRYGYNMPDSRRTEKDPFYEVICIRKHKGNTWITVDSEADWFLFFEDEHLKMIKDKTWPQNN